MAAEITNKALFEAIKAVARAIGPRCETQMMAAVDRTMADSIKPAEPERKYPQTQMTPEDMANAIHHRSADVVECTKLANAALRHACDNGQIVTREEFDRAVGDSAKRDMTVAYAVADAVSQKARDSLEGTIYKYEVDLAAIIAEVK